jgi:hypothetical protein
MAIRLSVLIRLVLLLLVGTTLIALIISQVHSPQAGLSPVYTARWDLLNLDRQPRPQERKGVYLIDRISERCDFLPMPEGERWGLLSVSPWCDVEGKAEVVGLCYTPSPTGDGHLFWGIARMQLPDLKVIDRLKLDLLPTGRPCWLPGRPGEILFAAGDGNLYRFNFEVGEEDRTTADVAPGAHSQESKPRPVTWKCAPPGGGMVSLSDPVWSSHPKLRHLLTAALTFHKRSNQTLEPSQLWWFIMSQDGMSIEAAGPLCGRKTGAPLEGRSAEHFPNVAVNRDGSIHLVYLSRPRGQYALRLEAMEIEVDLRTGRPRLKRGCQPRVLAHDCAAVPPVFAADGDSVFMISGSSGRLARYRVNIEDVPTGIEVAGGM